MPAERDTPPRLPDAFWSRPVEEIVAALDSSRDGLTGDEAARRALRIGPNELEPHRVGGAVRLLYDQLRSPLLLLLFFAAGASYATGDVVDAVMVLLIATVSVLVGFWREYRAERAASLLRARVRAHSTVLRDGVARSTESSAIVPGDVVLLSAGNLVPADALILEATDFHVNQAVLTGESFPVRKRPGIVAAASTLAARTNCVYLGSNVRSGTARCLVVATAAATAFGAIAERLAIKRPETEFDRGIRRFGYLLATIMFVMVLVVFAVNVVIDRPALETLLFAIALAVGLSPELLPAILNVNLSRGAQTMAGHGVLVRRLSAIENLGSMDVLCTDKTGTLTEGVVRLAGALAVDGETSARVLELASLNAGLQRGLDNPLDAAITAAAGAPSREKLGEIPYDFVRRRLSVIVADESAALMITKGSVASVLDACTSVRGGVPLDGRRRLDLLAQAERWNRDGIRVLAVATRAIERREHYVRDDERELTLEGWLTFNDRPKAGAAEAVARLGELGVRVTMITGDTAAVALHVADAVGLPHRSMLSGADLDALGGTSLWRAAEETDLFVEVDPVQKERIIAALRRTGHVVGFLGDGINDAPAMHAADTSLSVESATDVAREAADFVLLDRDLDVIRQGILEGRRTFANTLKYILTTMSANLGNMISMAVASVALPFLPLTAGQILLNNFLSDVPAVGIAGDSVDHELVERPQRWDIRFIGRFMVEFGALSSLFDILTFATLLYGFGASVELFRTGWFVESLLTELFIALVVRTRRPSYRSRPGALLTWSTIAVASLTIVIALSTWTRHIGFEPLPAPMLLTVLGITAAYVVAAELLKPHLFGAPSTNRLTRHGRPITR